MLKNLTFELRSQILTAARNVANMVAPGILDAWACNLRPGHLFIIQGKIARCWGINRTHVSWSYVDESHCHRSFMYTESTRVKRLDLLDDNDIRRFLNGTQLEFIEHANASISIANDRSLYLPKRKITPAQRERERRDAETPAQAEERRRKNRENMRRKRAMKKH